MADFAPPYNLPAALSSFVGRGRERVEVAGLLEDRRLVTLSGSPGVGKSRLALEVAVEISPQRPDGVWLVELAAVAEPALLPQVVATELGIRERPGRDVLDTLVDELRQKRLLIILDNCEHLVGACAHLAERLLQHCPALAVLATSREPLGLTGEWVRRVEPLGVPLPGQGSLDSVVDHDAVRLFVERAAATSTGFELNDANAETVAGICRRLDGLPLAIELAAARLEMLAPAQILEQLDGRFPVLRAAGRAAPACHASLLAALDWSHHLLSGPEATLLRRLSVFAGGCTLGAVEQVCADDGVGADEVVELLGGLVRKSLVVADPNDDEIRYRLLETVSDFAAEKLRESSEEDAVRGAHCRWAEVLTERADAQLASGTQAGWLRRLEAEQDNFRAAFEWALTHDRTEPPLRLGGALALFWWLQGHVREGRQLLERALGAGADEAPDLRAKALWGAAFLIGSAGAITEALPLAEESAALSAGGTDDALGDRARNLVGLLSMYRSPVEALPLLEDNLRLARDAADVPGLASSLCTLGSALLLIGDAPTARARLNECLDLARGSGNRSLAAQVRGMLGQAALAEGDYDDAEAQLRAGLETARELGERGQEAVVLSWMGELARGRGDYDRARAVLAEALALAGAVGRPFLTARCTCFLGRVTLDQANAADACAHFTEALTMALPLGLSYLHARCLLGLGEIARLDDDPATAQAHFDEATAVAQVNGDRQAVAAASLGLANLARSQGPVERARSLCHQALSLQEEIGDLPGLATSLELLAALCGPGPDGVRLFGAAQALRDAGGYARPPGSATDYDRDLTTAGGALDLHERALAWDEGRSLSVGEAVAYASRGRGVRRRPATGWASLTPAEHDVALLAAEGLTNREIGERLFVSPRTVGAHLAHVFAKLGVASRRELSGARRGPPAAGLGKTANLI